MLSMSMAKVSTPGSYRMAVMLIMVVTMLLASFPKSVEAAVSTSFSSNADFIHHNYSAMVDLLNEVNSKCPRITQVYNPPGHSVQNRNLTVIEFSDNPGHHTPGKKLLSSPHTLKTKQKKKSIIIFFFLLLLKRNLKKSVMIQLIFYI